MNNAHRYRQVFLRASLVSAVAFTATNLNSEAATITSKGAGNWNNPAIWNPENVPTSADSVFVRNGLAVTVSASQAANALTLGEADASGAIILNSSASVLAVTTNFNVMRSGASLTNIQGILTMSNGTLNVGGTMNVGVGATSGSGTATLSGGAFNGAVSVGSTGVNISNNLLSLGYFNVVGSSTTISGSTFAANPNGRISFAFSPTGVSMLDYTTATFSNGSTFSIDGGLYSGSGGDFKLVDSTTLSWNVASGAVSLTGFSGYTTQLLTANNEVVLRLTAVPETSVATLMLTAAPVIGMRRKRRPPISA